MTQLRRLRDRFTELTGAKAWRALSQATEVNAVLLGRTLAQANAARPFSSLRDVEFKVFSQFGDDGIIQYLVHRLQIPRASQSFVEFGVQDYSESNTRFLLFKDNWRGLILDGSQSNIDAVRRANWFWRYDLDARRAWIDRDNINSLIESAGFAGDLGLLSVDIDGNDYWVWERLTVVKPRLVVAEYNALFGSTRAVTVPYDPTFERSRAHFSNLYWGASLSALVRLASTKGYAFVGCNSAGNNAHFIRRDLLPGDISALTSAEGFVPARFRESRDRSGRLSLLGPKRRAQIVKDLEVYDVEAERLVKLSEVTEGASGELSR